MAHAANLLVIFLVSLCRICILALAPPIVCYVDLSLCLEYVTVVLITFSSSSSTEDDQLLRELSSSSILSWDLYISDSSSDSTS